MADAFVQIPSDGSGKKIRSQTIMVGVDTVHVHYFIPCSSDGEPVTSVNLLETVNASQTTIGTPDADPTGTGATYIAGQSDSGTHKQFALTDLGQLYVDATISATAASPTAVSVGVASGVVLAANSSRRGLMMTNTSSARISFNFVGGAAVLDSGLTLYPGQTYTMDFMTFTTAEIRAIASAAASNLAVQSLT